MKHTVVLLAGAAPAFASFPAVGPDYQTPQVEVPSAYRDMAATDAEAPDAEWWRSFGDPVLDELIERAFTANQDLRAALARVEQARAIAGVARSEYLPSLAADPALARERHSRTVDNAFPDADARTQRISFDLSWELDLFGRVRRLNEGARADLQASSATFAAARLALAAEVAANWFTLGALDRELEIVTDTVRVRRDALKLVDARVRRGSSDDLDLARAETELASAEAEEAALGIRRSSMQNALAVLIGEAAPSFLAPPTVDALVVPEIPAGLPADLLARRPDVVAAERRLASASARVGVAKAAFYPAISLTGSAGYASAELGEVFQSESRLWSIGPSIYLPVFQGGRNRANLARSRAVFEESLAAFRQSVLVALREVQDALTATRLLEEQAAAQARAAASARRGKYLSQRRYDAGFVSYFEVVDAQRTALAVERAGTQLAAQRQITRVALIKALGGGW